MGLVSKIIQTILMVVGCIVIVSVILYFYVEDQIKEPYEDQYVPREVMDTTIHETDNILYWEWDSVMDSVDMECGD